MTLRLTIDAEAWRAHIEDVRAHVGGLVPVVKGNGYGIGRTTLAEIAAPWSGEIAVGTVNETGGLEHVAVQALHVLTPALDHLDALPTCAVPTIGSPAHAAALGAAGWRGRVSVKLESSMHRYGVAPDRLDALVEGLPTGCTVHAYVLHLPFAGDGHVGEVERWLAHLDPSVPVSVSHLDPGTYGELRARHPDRWWQLRMGTQLWHGDKSALHLDADVLEVRRVVTGQAAGYRGVPVACDGHLVMIGAGSAHGVTPLADGRSPFHFAHRRLALHEPPHMHTSMVVVPDGDPCPAVGERVDVQRPLITVSADEIVWR